MELNPFRNKLNQLFISLRGLSDDQRERCVRRWQTSRAMGLCAELDCDQITKVFTRANLSQKRALHEAVNELLDATTSGVTIAFRDFEVDPCGRRGVGGRSNRRSLVGMH